MHAGGVQTASLGVQKSNKMGYRLRMGCRRGLGLSKPTGSVQMGRWVVGAG